jgi:N-glycosidase YbiA
MRPDWEKIKDEIMYKGVFAKFSQRPKLRQILLDTGDAELVEHTNNDSYWGDGGDGSGENKLGKILQQVRAELKLQGAESPKSEDSSSKDSQKSPPTKRRKRE